MESLDKTFSTCTKERIELKVNLLDHCAFCLRKLCLPEERADEPQVGRKRPRKQVLGQEFSYGSKEELALTAQKFLISQSSSLLIPGLFHALWPFLIPNCGVTPTFRFWSGLNYGLGDYLEIPGMCVSCGNAVEHLRKLMNEVLLKATEIQNIVKESGKSGPHKERYMRFHTALTKSALEVSRVESTLKFLEMMDGSVGNDNRQIGKPIGGDNQSEGLYNMPRSFLSDLQTQQSSNCFKEAEAEETRSAGINPRDKISSGPECRAHNENFIADQESPIAKSINDEPEADDKEVSSEVESPEEDDDDTNESVSSDNDDQDTDGNEYDVKDEDTDDSSNDCREEDEEPCWDLDDNFKEESSSSVDPLSTGTTKTLNSSPPKNCTVKKRARKHKGRDLKNLQRCDFCAEYIPISKIIEHMKSHVGDYMCFCPNPSCSKVFSCPATMEKRHLLITDCRAFVPQIAGKPRKSCEACGFETHSRVKLVSHLQREHETATKTFLCPVASCEERFSVRQSVQAHIFRHTNDVVPTKIKKIFPVSSHQSCPVCRKVLELEEMENHLKNAHAAADIVTCKFCPYLFEKRLDLISHLRVHLKQGKILSCDLCNDPVKYDRHVKLREHYFTVHNIGSKVMCEHCNLSFFEINSLNNHMAMKHAGTRPNRKPQQKFCCDIGICILNTKQFSSENALRRHKIVEHGAEPYGCKLCGEKFNSRPMLIRHEKEHKGTTPPEFRCDIGECGKTFKSNQQLKRHKVSIDHLGRTNQHVCELCGNGFNHVENLRAHVQKSHGTRPICEECGESFSNEKCLIRHKLIHSGERPFECPICHQRFRQSEVLRVHQRSHELKGDSFRPTGPMKNIRKRVLPK